MAGTNAVTPFRRFTNGLHHVKKEFIENIDEMLAFAEVMALKTNCIEYDENGCYYVQASGPLEDVITIMYHQLERLERMKQQKDNKN